MVDHVANRSKIIQRLKEELVGPAPNGQEINCEGQIIFTEASQSYGPWCQIGSKEEIITRDSPTKRYGVGVLYPLETPPVEEDQSPATPSSNSLEAGSSDASEELVTEQAGKYINKILQRGEQGDEADPDDFDLSSANTYRPSSMAVSFVAEFPEEATLIVEASGGRYHQRIVQVEGKERTWWLRSPVSIKAMFDADEICSTNAGLVQPEPGYLKEENVKDLDLRIEVFTRRYESDRKRLVTVCLINRKKASWQPDAICLFQAHFKAFVVSPGKSRHILPYPESIASSVTSQNEEEELSLTLLYRNAKTFAVGHGCSASWGSQDSPENEQSHLHEGDHKPMVEWVSAECLPAVEIPSVTPDIQRDNGTPVEVPMAPLAGLMPGDDGFNALDEVVDLYELWIEKQQRSIASLASAYQDIARKHILECRRCVQRMREGIAYLKDSPKALRAFQLANYAMVLQQIRSKREPRKIRYDKDTARYLFDEEYETPDPFRTTSNRGKWRAFQIAFLLMTIRSTVDRRAPDRRTVELIWFPTGGGKTEAYLALAAFSIFMRRLENPQDRGVHVLMRYTLRLLTAQQFQRASGLLCAMEYLRRQNVPELGETAFSIGVWLGGVTTPNTRRDAVEALNGLLNERKYVENQFIISKCPWCHAQMGPLKTIKNGSKMPKSARVPGYEQQGNTVVFKCPDSRCEFTRGLPIYVIDEDIYAQRPSLVIGTVDKFALLAWKPEVRSLFGIGRNGQREASPPGLIIQDELHLISGPLGSMVGLYETVIEELCTDRREAEPVSPKIISSTATIRRYAEQIKALYGRDDVALFPPPGLDAGDSFFSSYARFPDGSPRRGRIFVGVHAPGLGSLQTAQVRTFAALLQAPMTLLNEERDPWWTLLLFFNSLRELGTTLSLFQSDIPDYSRVLRNRMGLESAQMRRLWNILELTGRLKNEEVPEAISALEVSYPSVEDRTVDVCLASSIIEVGIDIDRLALMCVVGQPKTTSQYIQVTGRVGRQWWDRPGVIVTIYGASKPRDRSHFEKFRSYHERLYAQVEPTSVTPFSPPVLDRALHATIVAYVRQTSNNYPPSDPYPFPSQLIETWHQIMLPRVEVIDREELENFERVFKMRTEEWKRWERRLWTTGPRDNDITLLRRAGAYASRERARLSWPTPNSMRDVDAECQALITRLYAMEEGENNGE